MFGIFVMWLQILSAARVHIVMLNESADDASPVLSLCADFRSGLGIVVRAV